VSITSELSTVFGEAFVSLGLAASFGEVVVSQRPELAQFQCNGALAAARTAAASPHELAAKVVTAVGLGGGFAELTVAGPGFINIRLTDEALADHLERMREDGRLGVPPPQPRTIVVDYGGPNVAKELHVGHLRPALIGESLKRLMRFVGYEVLGDVHLGDWGTPMGQLIVELERRRPELPYFDPEHTGPYPQTPPVTVTELNEMYPAASARAAEDPAVAEAARRATLELQGGRAGYRALWQHFRDVSVAALKEVYDDLGVEFDLWYGESSIASRLDAMIERLRAEGHLVESGGALIIHVSEDGDTADIPPMLLSKSDGATLYTTWDLATIEDRIESLGADEMIYVVDNRQSLHFEQVFRAARKTGIAGPGVVLEHAGNGTVNGIDGRPLKTRDGNLPLLRDLIAEAREGALRRMDERGLALETPEEERREIARLVGLAALKYGDLQNHRASDYVFDLDRFTSFDGKTGPYLLYGAVRMGSILREAEVRRLVAGPFTPPQGDTERNLVLQLLRLPDVLERAVVHRAPNHLAEHAYTLAADFNRFYETCHILSEKDPQVRASWLGLVTLSRRQIAVLLDLLGIEIPERM